MTVGQAAASLALYKNGYFFDCLFITSMHSLINNTGASMTVHIWLLVCPYARFFFIVIGNKKLEYILRSKYFTNLIVTPYERVRVR